MPDRKKILHELDHQVADADWCDNDWKDNVPIWMLRGALTLLREQEPVKPTWRLGLVFCGKCGRQFGRGFKYCPDCGQAVKWD